MTLSFRANHVVTQDEDGVFIVGFMNDAASPSEYILLQKAVEDFELGSDIGLDGVYIERNDQKFSSYGGIEKLQLFRHNVEIILSESTAVDIGNVDKIEIHFDIGDDEVRNLRSILQRIFRGTQILKIKGVRLD